jgi:hypothetical protein
VLTLLGVGPHPSIHPRAAYAARLRLSTAAYREGILYLSLNYLAFHASYADKVPDLTVPGPCRCACSQRCNIPPLQRFVVVIPLGEVVDIVNSGSRLVQITTQRNSEVRVSLLWGRSP